MVLTTTHLYCLYKLDFNFLLYKLNLLTIPELRVLIYWNDFDYKLPNKPNKKTIQEYIDFLIHHYTFHCKHKKLMFLCLLVSMPHR